ncbi:ComEC/Rec2 family competence protein [Helicobacter saguini]|uniref:ComEC/Rec2 family competence protein n=1 Tax=Helicobacter saguini TaxID=1548018 RepID=A0A099BAB0_9HELI|nr:ComEC/Rec2 family competence protein [Helicobacter saguini]MWV62907.1 ComEC/Rec2 family competence protein [Helicobacter saguini]MWV66423.1 ComEC/Rec2 family competence protein [Helicobacter saguini]MWV68774.1 ComEC/Rec2 family competence protein [Helicobacter saguini]MWV71672.1 ComEC/Rec2 family competence protein [Helicobacter saguini]TLD94473.1 ComEC/Rec2 family competence protein [Helicobacter saguini]
MKDSKAKKVLDSIIINTKKLYYIDTRQKKSGYFFIYIPFKHYCVILGILSVIFLASLYHKYSIFKNLQQGLSFEAIVVNHYPKTPTKKGNFSENFKLQDSSGNVFYATYKGRFKNIIGKKVRVYGKIYKCSFLQFLKSCRIYNSTISLVSVSDPKKILTNFIKNQHESSFSSNLYNALFFAETLAKPVRDASVALGLAHLIAISGFHLSALLIMFFAIISPFYFIFHKFYCYRNAYYDLGFLGLIFAFFYLLLIDFEPSFLRAFIMSCAYFLILLSGLRIFSFLNLFLCVFLAVAFNPSLLFHIGFLLSVSGVFFIFLFVRHIQPLLNSKNLARKIIYGILLFDIIIFLQMMPVVHFFFPYFSLYQLVSIPLSIVFFALFPLLVFLHLIGKGNIFDSIIESCIAHNFFLSEVSTPLWLLLIYIIFSLLGIRYKVLYFITIIFSLLFYIYNCFVFFDSMKNAQI